MGSKVYVLGVVAALGALVPACVFGPLDASGRRCDSAGRCAVGYVCVASSNECVPAETDAGMMDASTSDAPTTDAPTTDAPTEAGSAITLTVTFASSAIARMGTGILVTSSVGHACGATSGTGCSLVVAPGDVELRVAAPWMTVESWGTSCAGGPTCSVTVTADTTLVVTPNALGNLAFVTSGVFAPTAAELSTSASANGACNAAATAGQLPGTYVALLTTDFARPFMALSLVDRQRGWLRLDGRPLAHVGSDIDAFQVHPLDIDERGRVIPVSRTAIAWVTLLPVLEDNGTPEPATDDDYYVVGAAHATFEEATSRRVPLSAATPFAARLYCYQAPTSVFPALPRPARDPDAVYLFTSAGLGMLGTRAALDARCAGEATTAGLPGTYQALLGTPSRGFLRQLEAHPRFADPAVMVRRADHYPLATLHDLLTTNPLVTTPSLWADGATQCVATVATGASLTDPTSSDTHHCAEWSATVGELTTTGLSSNSSWAPSAVGDRREYSLSFGSYVTAFDEGCEDVNGLAVYCVRTD